MFFGGFGNALSLVLFVYLIIIMGVVWIETLNGSSGTMWEPFQTETTKDFGNFFYVENIFSFGMFGHQLSIQMERKEEDSTFHVNEEEGL